MNNNTISWNVILRFKPATFWTEWGRRGPSLLGTGSDCPWLLGLWSWWWREVGVGLETGNVKRLGDFHVTLFAEKIGSFQCSCLTICLFLVGIWGFSHPNRTSHRDWWTPTQVDTLLLSPINKYLVSVLASHSQKTSLNISPLVQKSSVSSDCQRTNYWDHHSRPSISHADRMSSPFSYHSLLQRLLCFSSPVLSTLSYILPSLLIQYHPSFKSQLKSSLLAKPFLPSQPEGNSSPLNAHPSCANSVTALCSSPLNDTDLNCAGPLIHGSTYTWTFYSTVP